MRRHDAVAIPSLPAEVVRELKRLETRRKHRFLLLRLDDGDQVALDATAPLSASFDDLMHALPASECRFVMYDHDFAASGRPKLFFITWIPQDSPSDAKKAYIQAKSAVLTVCGDAVEVDAACKQQVECGVGVALHDGDAATIELSSPVCFMSFMAF
jgi:cofilin